MGVTLIPIAIGIIQGLKMLNQVQHDVMETKNMTSYINIHTHHHSKEDGVFLFNNRLGIGEDIFTGNYFSAGIHPWDSDLNVSLDDLEKLINGQNCLAIGECGLDTLKGPELEIQKKIFKSQLDLAVKYQKPVIIHCVKAFDALIDICKLYHSKITLIIHGFNKSFQLAEQLINKGFYLSLHYSVFNSNKDDFKIIPMNKIFLETDHNKELSIAEVYNMAAHYFNVNEDELKEKIYTNFVTLFNTNGR